MEPNLITQLCAGGIFAVLVIDRVFKFVNGRNHKANPGPTRANLRDEHAEMMRSRRERDEVMFKKMDEQTSVLHNIDTTQKVMCERLANLKERT